MEGLALRHPQHPTALGNAYLLLPNTLIETAEQLGPGLHETIAAFWGIAPKARLLSISKDPHYYWHMQDFYVAQKSLDADGKRWAQLRLSENLCQLLFESTLGKAQNEPDFTLARIRNFEVFLLERFSRKLFQLVSPPLLKRPSLKAPPPDQDELMHLVWALEGEPEQVNQIILTAPHVCLKTPSAEEKPASTIWQLPAETFFHATTQVAFRLGTTGARLEDLKQLEPGDILLCENSHVAHWQLQDPITGQWLTVNVRVPDRLKIPDLIAVQGHNAMTNDMEIKQNIWDNLEVEVTATFNPVKLPLKQIKEMEQGLVVEVGDLMDNRVQIEVEGHPIAWGELLVIGDKFGVRIQGLHESVGHVSEKSATLNTMSSQQPHPMETPVEQQAPNNPMGLDLDETDFDDLDDEEDWT